MLFKPNTHRIPPSLGTCRRRPAITDGHGHPAVDDPGSLMLHCESAIDLCEMTPPSPGETDSPTPDLRHGPLMLCWSARSSVFRETASNHSRPGRNSETRAVWIYLSLAPNAPCGSGRRKRKRKSTSGRKHTATDTEKSVIGASPHAEDASFHHLPSYSRVPDLMNFTHTLLSFSRLVLSAIIYNTNTQNVKK